MRNIWILAEKELKLYFISPIAYVLATVFLIITDYLFQSQVFAVSSISMQIMRSQGNLPQFNLHEAIFQPIFFSMSIILLLIMPLLTMRLFAEEKKGRTSELLMTSPLTITEIVLGKFLAAWIIYALLLLLTMHLPVMMTSFTHVAWKPLVASYLGLFLMGGVFLSMGLFASSLTENQIVAAVISFGILIGFWLIGLTAQTAADSSIGELFNYLSLIEHLANFVKGLINTRDLTYFISLMILGLFLTHRVVESQRWK